ncbi:STY4526/YPO1902 family pathogenicity island replication protein [Paracidovorax oryzae]|uniref:STY4526/YPO1902 family pathogenicity island replication protein n=1 Tax=Paracidovorax oryzae TaxID=862720 RepID=UPI0009DB2FC2|nr:STY4526/YPO1902 family pathogenicity island replication protein [Paracidovorax oryzae]
MINRRLPIEFRANDQLNYLLLTELVRLIETEDGLVQLLEHGCDAELIDGLRRRSSRDLLDLAARMREWRVSFSPIEMRQHLNGIDRQRRDSELCEYFIKNGASQPLVARLFSKSATEIRKLRDILVGGGAGGRTRLPRDLSVRDEIHREWYEISRAGSGMTSLRDRLYKLHLKFSEYSIDTLYSTIREFERGDVVLCRARRPGESQTAA